jgi:5-methylcytosine-specific restriction endonuclease McrA
MLVNCKNCNKEFKVGKNSTGKYCSLVCTFESQKKERRQNFLEGKVKARCNLRKHLLDIYGHKCSVCNNTEWLGTEIPLEVDHIDGNASNNFPDNLRMICPNCHAQTPTHNAKNKGNGRKSRGMKYYS